MTRAGLPAAWLLLFASGAITLARSADVEIREDYLRRHVQALADDSLAGRAVGERGIRLAEDYVAGQLKRSGLQPISGLDGFFHDFETFRRRYTPGSNRMDFLVGEQVIHGEHEVDFQVRKRSGVGTAEGPLVFAGYGIVASRAGYDDYEGLQVEGRIVIVLAHEPGEAQHRPRLDQDIYDKANTARKRGALALIEVTDPLHHPPGDDMRISRALRLNRPRLEDGDDDEDDGPEDSDGSSGSMLVLEASRDIVGRLLAGSDRKLADLQRAVDEGTRPRELNLGDVRARIRVAPPAGVEVVPARNVVGALPGRSPELAGEWILVAAHHDHLGHYRGEGDTIYNGADDNASGVAGLLEIARSLAADEQRPDRSVVFVTYSAEEQKLLGARAMARDHGDWLERIAFMVNLDMIGRNPEHPLLVLGDGHAAGARSLVEPIARRRDVTVRFSGDFYTGKSDHDVFFRHQLPFLTLFSGYHRDYHRPGDEPDRLAYPRMTAITAMARDLVAELARMDRPPVYRYRHEWLGATLGNETRAGRRVPVVVDLSEASAGERGGLQVGDVILEVNGRPVTAQDVSEEIGDSRAGTRMRLAVLREDKRRVIKIQRPAPGYLGIYPVPLSFEERTDLGLSGFEGIYLFEVREGGPGGQAGLAVGDTLITIDGQPLSYDDLDGWCRWYGEGARVRLGLIRNGRPLTVDVTLGRRPRS